MSRVRKRRQCTTTYVRLQLRRCAAFCFSPLSHSPRDALQVDPAELTESAGNQFGVKVAIHEYMHVLQQGFLTKDLTSTTPPTDTLLANRFQVKRFGTRVPLVFETKVKAVLDALPASLKLLTVPTYFILIAGSDTVYGIGDEALIESSRAEMLELAYGVSTGCVGVDFFYHWAVNENIAMAEGEAEYYASFVYTAPGANTALDAWTTPFNGATAWAEKKTENAKMLAGTADSNVCSCGKSNFHVKSGSSQQCQFLEESTFKWRTNPVGELVWQVRARACVRGGDSCEGDARDKLLWRICGSPSSLFRIYSSLRFLSLSHTHTYSDALCST